MKRFVIGIMALLLCFGFDGCREDAPPEMQSTLPETEQTTEATYLPTVWETVPENTDPAPLPEPGDEAFVRVLDYIPDLEVELKYATADNFTGQIIYEFQDAYLRYGTVKKLMGVQEELRQQKLSLKIWDAFRPTGAQFVLWEVCPNPKYVADPNRTFSAHSRGNTVDVTIVDEDGEEIPMPTGFDDFSPLADRDYSDCAFDVMLNALLLEQTMERHGFAGYKGEWWHFTDTDGYPVEETFRPEK